MDSKIVDLIATDPPFNKGVPTLEGTTKAGVDVEFKDVWNWDDDAHTTWTNSLIGEHPSLYNVFRPHESLRGWTPAEVAGVRPPFKEWEDLAKPKARAFTRGNENSRQTASKIAISINHGARGKVDTNTSFPMIEFE